MIDPITSVLNASNALLGFTISGTTIGVEDGQTVSISVFDGINPPLIYSAMVVGNVWSASVPPGDVMMLADGTATVTASVTDAAGNPAIPASQPLAVDETAPTLVIDPIAAVNAQGVAAGFAISGTTNAEDGQVVSVQLMDGMIPLGSYSATVSGGVWSTSVPTGDTLGLADGSYTIAAEVMDQAGNQALPATQSLTVDETAPTLTIDPIAAINIQDAAAGFALTGTTNAEDGQVVTVQLMDGAIPMGSYSATVSGGVWSASVPAGDTLGLADGSYTAVADVSDAAGNPAIPATQPLAVDETAPIVAIDPIIPVLNALGAATGFTITGTTVGVEDGQTVSISVFDGINPPLIYSAMVVGNVWSASVLPGDATMLADGTATVTASVTDAAGNPAIPASQPLAVDETAPMVTISGTGGPTNQMIQTVTGTADLSVVGQMVTVSDGIAPPMMAIVQPDGSWSVGFPLLGEGAHNLTATVTDLAGNTASSSSVTYTLDMTPPVVTIDPNDPVNATAAAVGFTISGTTNAEDGQTVSVQLFNGLLLPVGDPYTATAASGHWSIIVPSTDHLIDGSYTASATVTDQAGNPALPASQPFMVDETAPVVAIINPGGLTNQPAQTVSGIADPLDVGHIVTVMEGSTALGVATVGVGGFWTTAVTLSGDGVHNLTAAETDTAGNTGTSSAVSYTLDTTPPAVTIFGTGGPTNQTAQVVGGTGELGASVTVWDGITSVGSALVDLNGNWSTSVNLTSDGPHSLTATQTDAAGNTGTSGSSVDYTLDTAAAAVVITSLGRLTNQAMQTVGGTVDPSEAGATVKVWDGTTALGTATAASDGRWNATIVLAGDGPHSLMASETDAAGNTGTSNAVVYTLDTTPVASGDNNNPYAGAIGQQLTNLLGSLGDLSYFGPNQPIPDSSTGSPALLISSSGGSPVTVPGGVSVVRNQASGVELQGSGQANQVVVSSVGFTYHSNGGSGVVLADEAQAGGPAGNSNIVLARSGGGDFLISTGSGDDTVDAASGNVSVAAGGGHNMVWLGSGDALVTSSGADTVVSGTGAATVHATAGSEALVFGGASTLTFMGDSGAATVVGGAGSTNLVAGSGNAVFWGSENGGNTMYAGTGAATLVGGGSGNVIHAAGSADLLLVAGSGNSTLVGGSATGNNFYWGSKGDDMISADQGNDTIIGGPGHDTVQAGGGNALIFGGVDGTTFVAGSGTANIVSGNGGANTFAFINGQAGGTEIIWGFRTGTDHLSLQGYGADELANATAGAQGYGPGTQIGLSDGTKIIFGDIASLKAVSLS
jgi:Ca2+-binding RTX toxin-like protein